MFTHCQQRDCKPTGDRSQGYVMCQVQCVVVVQMHRCAHHGMVAS